MKKKEGGTQAILQSGDINSYHLLAVGFRKNKEIYWIGLQNGVEEVKIMIIRLNSPKVQQERNQALTFTMPVTFTELGANVRSYLT